MTTQLLSFVIILPYTEDTDDTMKTKQLVNKYHVKAKVDFADSNPNMTDFEGNHFKVTLRMSGRSMTVHFSQGYGINGEPTAASVLECLLSDASGFDNSRSFEEWCSEYGYDTDSRKAERIYKVVEAQNRKLRTLLGEHYEEFLYSEQA